MNILTGSPKDINKLLSLCQACAQNLTANSIDQWDEVYPNKDILLKDLENHSLYIIADQSAILGCIVLNDHQDPEYQDISWKYGEERIAVIHRLMVHPQSQGKGLAQHLVRFAEKLAGELKYRALRLDVFSQNPRAIRFYESLGYERTGQVTFRKGEFFCYEKLIQRSQI